MHKHFAGDGCDGSSRPLNDADMDAIAEQMGEMMIGVAREDMPHVIRSGAWVGVHYGPNGEWVLAQRLAYQICGLAPTRHRNAFGQPSLTEALPPDDQRVTSMTHHCAAMFPEAKGHTSADIIQAISLAVPHVESFVHHFKGKRQDECRATWEWMYETAEVEAERDMAKTLRAGAASALLTCWAAHYSVQHLTP